MTTTPTDSAYVRRLAAAARAAWWTFLIGASLAMVQFLVYAAVSHRDALWSCVAGMLSTDPQDANRLFLHFMIAARLILIIMVLVAVFLSLWVHRLRHVGDA